MRREPPAGFTLTEIMVTVGIIAIIAAFALPGYQKTVEIRHRQAAEDILQTIYAGEQVYKSASANNNTYVDADDSAACTPAIWKCIYMDDPNGNAILPVAFTIVVNNGVTPPTFTATATRTGTPVRSMTIDQDRVLDTTNWPPP